MKSLSRTVWALSLISLFTDTASEMLYPVMPLYLRHIGFSVLLIGVLEGVAEGLARRITETLSIPTIGIGASPGCGLRGKVNLERLDPLGIGIKYCR